MKIKIKGSQKSNHGWKKVYSGSRAVEAFVIEDSAEARTRQNRERPLGKKKMVYTYIIRTLNIALLMIEKSHKKVGTIK